MEFTIDTETRLPPEQVAEKFTFTDGQQSALNELHDWWNGKEQNIILSGSPGTGKTFLAAHFTANLGKAVPLFTAPTNEAVRQLDLSLKGKAPTKTTYSALGLTLSMSSYRQEIYQRKLPEDFYDFNLLIVDEASMAGKRDVTDKKAHDLLMDYVLRSGMRTIWLGDWAQLPPVESATGDSPVFEQGFKTLELTQVKRHAGDILDWAILLRETLTKPIKNLPPIPEGIPTKPRNSAGLMDFTDEEFDKIASDAGRIIVWTNSSSNYCRIAGVNQYNRMIRNRLFNEAQAAASNIYPTDRILFASPLMLAEKHEDLTLDGLTKVEDFEMLASVNAKAEVLKAERFILMGVECWKTELEVEGGTNALAYIPTNKGELQKAKIEKALRESAIAAGDSKKAAEGWQLYHTFRKCFGDVKHTYCITGHRSQGSTIDEVYVDVGNILQNRDRKVAFKNLYVSATRAKNKLTLIRG